VPSPAQDGGTGVTINTLPAAGQASPARWQASLRESFTDATALLAYLGLPAEHPRLAAARFPLRVPRGYAARMEKGNPQDPLFLQVWPAAEEARPAPGFVADAVGDLARQKEGGLIHKYRGRALVIATAACAVHCRYCFRQHFPYAEGEARRSRWGALIDSLAADTSIEEVILSGGDPLSLSDEKLAELVAALEAVPHLKRLRLHTRQPIVLPERVDDALLGWLAGTRLQTVIVLHANHARELDEHVATALARLKGLGIPLLNQAVLLRGVNDSVGALRGLSERLFACGVLPYYLHELDRVQGAAHHEVPQHEAKALMRGLASELPGYLVPRLVREVAGEPSKTWTHW